MLPQKFNKKLWVRKGGYVVVEEEEAAAADSKVSGLIVSILYEEHIKQLKKRGEWPSEFNADARGCEGGLAEEEPDSREEMDKRDRDEGGGEGSGDGDPDLPPIYKNTNRRQIIHEPDSDGSG